MSAGQQDLVQNVLAAESIPALTDDPVHDALVTAYFRADSTRNALVLSSPPVPTSTTTTQPAADKVDRAAVALNTRIAGTEELRQMLKRLILHCRGGAREMLANLTHVDLNVGLNVLRTAHVAQRCHAQAQASFEPVELRAARQSRLEALKTAGDVVAEYLHSRPKGGQGGVRVESNQPEGNAAPEALGPGTTASEPGTATPTPASPSSHRLPSSQTPIEFWHGESDAVIEHNRGAILRRLQLDPARQDTFSSLEEVFAALLGTNLSLDDIKALTGLHQLSFIASLAFPAERFHPLPDPVACPLYARGKQTLTRARQQPAATLAVAPPRDTQPHDGDGRTNGEIEQRGLCQLGQMSKALIWLGHHEAVSGSPDFETYLASRTPVASILRIVESVVMLVEEISKEGGTCPEDCHLYMVFLGQIAASKSA